MGQDSLTRLYYIHLQRVHLLAGLPYQVSVVLQVCEEMFHHIQFFLCPHGNSMSIQASTSVLLEGPEQLGQQA